MAVLAEADDWAAGGVQMLRDSALCLRRVAEAVVDTPALGPIHRHLARAWNLDEDGTDLIRRALVLCADHELNASTFAVRVVASTGAAVPHCVLAGLAALSGPLHGGMTSRVRAMLAESRIMADPRTTVAERLARGDDLPGFGHRLYPDGDPRATALLDLIGPAPRWRGLFAAILAQTGKRPNIDTALVALEDHLSLPEGAALAIFAVGRTVGWIAHALEQRQEGQLIRPRATYVGPPPGG
jgi:citrate synthase